LFAYAATAARGAETASDESGGTFDVKGIAKLQAGSVVNTRRGKGLETKIHRGGKAAI